MGILSSNFYAYSVLISHNVIGIGRRISNFLPPANEVWGKVIFFAPICHSVHRRGYLGRYPPGRVPALSRYTPQAGTSHYVGTPTGQVHPPGRYIPGQVHPPAGTPPRQVHPPGQVHPRQVHPRASAPPPERCMLGDTCNKRAVSILLECILVNRCNLKH